MDDYSVGSLVESKNEWCARLVGILAPLIIEGIRSIFEEAVSVCIKNEEPDKYLMTFQSFLGRVPSWNATLVSEERRRVVDKSGCSYLADLITCVHIIQLKALSCVRVGTQQKKIDIMIPSLEDFLHRVYIHAARKIFTNVYLFEKNVPPLQVQKYNRELEQVIKECVMVAIRDSIPVEDVLRAYMEETEEKDTLVQQRDEIVGVEPIEEGDPPASGGGGADAANDEGEDPEGPANKITDADNESSSVMDDPSPSELPKSDTAEICVDTTPGEAQGKVSFSDTDMAVDTQGRHETVDAPKGREILEQIEVQRSKERDAEEAGSKLSIGAAVELAPLDVNVVGPAVAGVHPPPSIEIQSLGPL